MRFGYVRVSTDDQHLERQRHALEAYGCDQIVEETKSGVSLEALLARLVAGYELIIEQIDRPGRGAGPTILLMDELFRRQALLRVLSLPSLDYATPHGRYVAHTFAALAEIVRGDMRQRPRAGSDAAKRAGRHLGRNRR